MDLKHKIGEALSGVRPGLDALVEAVPEIAALPLTLTLTSPAFADGAAMPARFSDAGGGVSPPLAWGDPPEGTRELVLIVEDADPPLPRPIVHAILVGLPPHAGTLAEAALSGPDDTLAIGRNSALKARWLPLAPPPGHGVHRYVLQLYALNRPSGLEREVGRGAVRAAVVAAGLARGRLVGTFETP